MEGFNHCCNSENKDRNLKRCDISLSFLSVLKTKFLTYLSVDVFTTKKQNKPYFFDLLELLRSGTNPRALIPISLYKCKFKKSQQFILT